MYTSRERPIGPIEADRLQKRIQEVRLARKSSPISFLGCLTVSLPLCFLVFVFNPWAGSILCGTFTLLMLGLQVFFSSELKRQARDLEQTLVDGSVEEHHVVAEQCLEISEDDGEASSTFLFDVGAQGTVVFYEEDLEAEEFPNTDFTLVYIFDRTRTVQDVHVETNGKPLAPVDVYLRSDIKDTLEFERLTLIPRLFEEMRDGLLRS